MKSALTQNKKRVLSAVKRIATKANYPHPEDITFASVETLVKVLADKYPEILAAEIAKMEKSAVNSYTSRGDAGDQRYERIFNVIEYIFKILKIELDYGVGLYPTYESADGHTEYNPLNALRYRNGYWK